MALKNFKAYPLKNVKVIGANTVLLTFYLDFGDWNISNDVLEIEIISAGIVTKYLDKLSSFIDEPIFVSEEDGYLEFYEGEYESECCTDTQIPFESYKKRIVPKSLDEWKQQYLSLVKVYYAFRRQAGI